MLPDLHHVKITTSMHFLFKKKKILFKCPYIYICKLLFFKISCFSFFFISDVNGLLKIH